MNNRRGVLKGLTGAVCAPFSVTGLGAVGRARRPLDILLLGGTGFLGPHMIDYALARGHRVTLFNRGRSAAWLARERVEVLVGNRDATIEPGMVALQGARRWDVVIDNSGYVPRHVRDSIEVLKDRVGRYLFVSTVAVYEPNKLARYDERSPTRAAPVPASEDSDRFYGPLKAECERIALAALGERLTIVRPTFIVGPGDDTDRFTYWVQRMARGGQVLSPPEPRGTLQWVDVRDLCPWIVALAERDLTGIFNVAGPRETTNWEQVLRQLGRQATVAPQLIWACRNALDSTGVRLPLVRAVAPGQNWPHFVSDAAQAAGLRYRPIADTAAATLTWWRALSSERRAAAEGWPSAAQEAELLQRSAVTNGC